MTVDLNPRFTFDSFIVGGSNRLAFTAAKSVAESPGTSHNPLFVYSNTGLGKTHLAMAIGHRALEVDASRVVEYLTLDEFVDGYHKAVAEDALEAFRRQYGAAQVLIIDDVQFLAQRQETQEELLRFATELKDAGTQVVLTSDCPPHKLKGLDGRIASELAGGLVADIGLPDFETRLAILNRRADERGVGLTREVLEVVAAYDVSNVRELIGILNRLIAFQAVSENALTPDAARVLLEGGTAATGAATAAPPEADEFSAFLTGVTQAVEEQVSAWKTHLRQTIQLWSDRGYRTEELERLLDQEDVAHIEDALLGFEQAVQRLQASELAIAELDPSLAEDPVFKDPLRVTEAESLLRASRENFIPPQGPSENYALETFVVGGRGEMAMGAVQTIIEHPGEHYNPLLILGPTGVGKTHLLHATGRKLEERLSNRFVACLSAQMFLDELVTAIEEDAIPAWRGRYRQAGALLLDDIDVIGGKERVQEELFYLINAFFDSKRQVVFTASVVPKAIDGLEARLCSRLEGGLSAVLEAPDDDMRRQLIEQQMRQRVEEVPSEVVDYIARQEAVSVRAVLGLVDRVVTAAEAQGRVVTLELASSILEAATAREVSANARGRAVVVTSSGPESPEKMVLQWPEPMAFVVEEF